MENFERIRKESGVACVCKNARQISTLGSGGNVNVFEPKNIDEMRKLCDCCLRFDSPIFMLGGGSNIVVDDNGVRSKIVISTRHINSIKMQGNMVYAHSGARVKDVTKIARNYGFGGLEFMAGVPCTVGGIARMNASAFYTKTSDYIYTIDILSVDNAKYEIKRISKYDVDFGYRKGVQDIVIGVTFCLDKMSEEESVKREKEYLSKRSQKQPKGRSVGSVFKNKGIASGYLIDECGLKGKMIGGMQISPLHANFIINVANGSSSDFLSLVKECENSVFDKFGITLDREFVYLY